MYGQVFKLVKCHHNWGEDRVYYQDAAGLLRSWPATWTSVVPLDPFVTLAAGRSAFRVTDLLALTRLLGAIAERREV